MSPLQSARPDGQKRRGGFNRRHFLKWGLYLAGGALLEACAPSATPTASTATAAATIAPTAAPATATLVPTAVPLGELVLPIGWLSLPFATWQEVLTQMVPELEKLGLTVNAQTVEANTWIAKTTTEHDFGDFTGTAFGLSGDRLDPNWALQELLHSRRAEPGGNNFAEYRSAEMDELIDAQAQELDPEARRDLIFQAQEIFARDTPIFPSFWLNQVQAYNIERWEGAVPVFGRGLFRWDNIDTYLNVRPKTDQTTLRVDNDHDGNSTNPFVASGGTFNTDTMRWVYDTLVKIDSTLSTVPWAAEAWNWVDDTTIDIGLRAGMAFHDGQPVTAEDLAFTINYAQEHQFPNWKSVLDVIDGATVQDELTVRLALKRVSAPFANTVLPFIFIVPKHLWETVSNPLEYENPDPVGSGPFTFGHWRKNESWLFNHNPAHFRAPVVDVLVAILPEPETMLTLLETGELDAVAGASLRGDAAIDRIEALDFMEVASVPGASTYFIIPNNDRLPGKDPTFRRAVHHVIPKERLWQVINGKGGGLTAGASWIHPDLPWHNPDLPAIEYNIETARQILADGGYGWDDQGRLHYPPGLTG